MNEAKTVILRQKNIYAIIDLTHGATCTDFFDEENKITVLYSSNDRFLRGVPILFPANRISGGSFTAGDHTYTLPIAEERTGCALHGEMNILPFSVVSQSESKVCCRREFKGDYPGFPQHFFVEIIYEITENTLIQTLRINNYSNIPLPLLFGFHTTFAIPFCSKSSADDIRLYADVDRFIERGSDYLPIDAKYLSDDFSLSLQKGEAILPQSISCHYRAGKNGDMTIFDARTGVLIRYEPDKAFRYRMIFTSDRDNYLCLEPQMCVTDAPNAPLDKEYTFVPLLSQGEKAEYISKISIEKTDSINEPK